MRKKLVFAVLLTAVIAVFGAVCCFADAPSADYRLLLSDEFDGDTLNTEIWDWRTGDPYGGKNLKENVRIEDGKLIFDYKKVDGYYTGGGVLTNFNLPYGYYETRAKVFGGTGRFHTSFWLSGGSAFTTKPENFPQKNCMIEIDGFEIDSEKPNTISHGIHYWWAQHESTSRWAYKDIDTSEEWFTMGMEWLPDRLNFYINGELVNTDDELRVYGPSYLWLTAVAMPEGKEDLIDDSKLPGKSEFEYFRYYQKPLKNVNLLGNGNFEYDRGGNAKYPYCYIVKGDTKAVFPMETPYAYDGNYCLVHYAADAYAASSGQEFCYLYPGKYTFSGMFRSSGGQKTARMVVYDKNGAVIAEKPIPKSENWQMITLSDIDVSGYAYVAVESSSDGGTVLYSDDLKFYCLDGEEYTAINTPDYENYDVLNYKGETVFNLDNASDKSDGWAESSLTDTSYWSSGDDFAEWTFTAPEDDDYQISLYNLVHSNNAATQKYIITVNGVPTETEVDTINGESGWITLLDSAALNEGDTITIRTERAQSRGNIRVSDIRIVSNPVLDSYLMPAMQQGSNMFTYGGRMYAFDRNDSSKSIYRENGQLYFPYKVLKDLTGITAEVPQTDGQYVYYLQNASDKSDNWLWSSLMSGSYYAAAAEDTFAEWQLTAPKDGTYYLDVYNLYYRNNVSAQKYVVTRNGEETEYIINPLYGESRWESLGAYSLSAGETITVRLTTEGMTQKSGYVRATKLLFGTGDYDVSAEQIAQQSDYTIVEKNGLIILCPKSKEVTDKIAFLLKQDLLNYVELFDLQNPKFMGKADSADQIVYNFDAAETTGKWIWSGLGGGSYYANPDANESDTTVTWNIPVPEGGKFTVQFYSTPHENSTTGARVTLLTNKGVTNGIIDQSSTDKEGWYDLGVVDLDDGENIFVRVMRYKASNFLRAKAVRLVPVNDSVSAARSGNEVTVHAGYGIHYYDGLVLYGEYDGDKLVKFGSLTPDESMTFPISGTNTYKVFFWRDFNSLHPEHSVVEERK